MQLSNTAQGLFVPKRNKILYGGRGGGKSHDIAAALLLQGANEKLFIVCAREIQKSIKDSVHRLLKNKINEDESLRLFYTVLNDKIVGLNGTEIVFTGLKHNPDAVKSLEGADRCWVEEADNVSNRSWEVLIPTIRKAGSEIWISFNPRYPTDPTYKRFVLNADEDCFVKKVNWRDNPWFPDILNTERLKLERDDPKAADHIWEGNFDERFSGAVYAKLLKESTEAKRLSIVPHKPGVPVITAWDLGKSDSTAIWFAQKIGLEVRVIDYYENNMEDPPHYAEVLRSKPYEYAMHYLPHDAGHNRMGMQFSISGQFEELGIKNKVLGTKISRNDGIQLGRELIQTAWIDQEKCKDGIHALNHYEYEWDENKQMFKSEPRHDWSSHGSDGWRYLAVALKEHDPEEETQSFVPTYHGGDEGWMG